MAERAGTEDSNDTDATLVEDVAPRSAMVYERSSTSPPVQSPTGSVLGKRTREGAEAEMDIDQATGSASPAQHEATKFIEEAIASSSKSVDRDVEMRDETDASRPPPLPPRKAQPTNDSVMMFGRSTSSAIRYESNSRCPIWLFRTTTRCLRMYG